MARLSALFSLLLLAHANADTGSIEKYTECLLKAEGWLPDSGVALCKAGNVKEVEKEVACIKKSYQPMDQESQFGLMGNQGQPDRRAVAQAGKVCKKHGYDADQAQHTAQCVAMTQQINAEAPNGCFEQDPGKYISCIQSAAGWLPDNGLDTCAAGKFSETQQTVSCVQKVYHPFNTGLGWNQQLALGSAEQICKLHDSDPTQSLTDAQCLNKTWGTGNEEKSGCGQGACVLNAMGWLTDSGLSTCKSGDFTKTHDMVACVKKAYRPLRSVARAGTLCEKHDYDADAAIAEAECLRTTGRLGQKAKAICTTDAASKFTSCLVHGSRYVHDFIAACEAGKYSEVEEQATCVRKAYRPFAEYGRREMYERRQAGLVAQATKVCQKNQNDAEVSFAEAKCLAVTAQLGSAAQAGCASATLLLTSYRAVSTGLWPNTAVLLTLVSLVALVKVLMHRSRAVAPPLSEPLV